MMLDSEQFALGGLAVPPSLVKSLIVLKLAVLELAGNVTLLAKLALVEHEPPVVALTRLNTALSIERMLQPPDAVAPTSRVPMVGRYR
jgi:hypothetical protein